MQKTLLYTAPSDELIQDVNILLHVRHLHWLFGVEDGERGRRGAVIDVAAAWLKETADEKTLEKGFCILEEFELATGCD